MSSKSDLEPRPAPRLSKAGVAQAARSLLALVVRSDIGLGYAAIVLAVFTWVEIAADPAIVTHASTNLANLRSHPVEVLFSSAFVVSAPADLVALPVLVVVYALAQREFGRVATLVTITIGHVLATLCVAVLLATGIFHGFLEPSIATVVDVGFSYGLACVMGLLRARVSRRYQVAYAVGLLLLWSWPVLLGSPMLRLTTTTFTDAGHTLALLTGFGLSTLAGSRHETE